MSGEKNLTTLLKSMSPLLMEGEYVFATFSNSRYGDHAQLKPIAMMSEAEGLTLVISKRIADSENIAYDSLFKGISLEVHSSLEAVGLTAAFATKLAEHGISANVIAGFYHDHIFVGSQDADRALAALQEFQ